MQQYSAHLINLYSLQMGLSYNWLGHIAIQVISKQHLVSVEIQN